MSNPKRYSGDRNFDDLLDQFTDRIYNTRKDLIRSSIHLVSELENCFLRTAAPCQLLDANGGGGPVSQHCAKHDQTFQVCDISTFTFNSAKKQRSAQTTFHHHESIQQLSTPPVDVLLCHAVLEWLENIPPVIQALMRLLKPNGRLSFLIYNVHGLRFKRLFFGELNRLKKSVEKGHGTCLASDYPCDSENIKSGLTKRGSSVGSETWMRCVSYFNPKDLFERLDLDELIDAEKTVSTQFPYRELVRHIPIKEQKQ